MKPAWICALCHNADVPRSKHKRALCEDCVDSLEARALAWCSKGHRVKASEMSPGKPWCRACERQRNASYARNRSEYRRQWYAAHPDAQQRYRSKPGVKERYAEQKQARYWADPERARAYSRAQYAKHRDRATQGARLWRQNNRELSRAGARLSYQRAKLRVWRKAA